jgi:hypothetical protein
MKYFISTERKTRRIELEMILLERVRSQIGNIFKIEIITMASPNKEDRSRH